MGVWAASAHGSIAASPIASARAQRRIELLFKEIEDIKIVRLSPKGYLLKKISTPDGCEEQAEGFYYLV